MGSLERRWRRQHTKIGKVRRQVKKIMVKKILAERAAKAAKDKADAVIAGEQKP